MTDKEFIEKRFELSEEEVKVYNDELCSKFPFLKIRDDNSWTQLDDMPVGWRIAFGIQLCEELSQELIKQGNLNNYKILEVKEKYGQLRIYGMYDYYRTDDNIDAIIRKYEMCSEKYCILCGEQAVVHREVGFPICDYCFKKYKESIPWM